MYEKTDHTEEQKTDQAEEKKVIHENVDKNDELSIKHDCYDFSLNVPIALRKGTRSFSQHPLHKFVSYSNMSPRFDRF